MLNLAVAKPRGACEEVVEFSSELALDSARLLA